MREDSLQVETASNYEGFSDPVSNQSLKLCADGLQNDRNQLYRFIDNHSRVIDFLDPSHLNHHDKNNIQAYDSNTSVEIYRNFLDWLFATFNQDEAQFRKNLIKKLNLSTHQRVLITGCGLGDDIGIFQQLFGESIEIHAQDISRSMVLSAAERSDNAHVLFSVSSATSLPYMSRYFDAVFHFGGINLFGDIKKAISEMERVCKVDGTILFGDEGIASHLRETEFAKIAINNIPLWALEPPIDKLPINAKNIELSYLLENCFYLIKFSPSATPPTMNIDIPHKGLRGGTARTRFYGQTEGLTENTKSLLIKESKNRNISVHELLEESLLAFLTR